MKQIGGMTEEEVEQNFDNFVGKWPNGYTFTKALSEQAIGTVGKGLPTVIVRPSVGMFNL